MAFGVSRRDARLEWCFKNSLFRDTRLVRGKKTSTCCVIAVVLGEGWVIASLMVAEHMLLARSQNNGLPAVLVCLFRAKRGYKGIQLNFFVVVVVVVVDVVVDVVVVDQSRLPAIFPLLCKI